MRNYVTYTLTTALVRGSRYFPYHWSCFFLVCKVNVTLIMSPVSFNFKHCLMEDFDTVPSTFLWYGVWQPFFSCEILLYCITYLHEKMNYSRISATNSYYVNFGILRWMRSNSQVMNEMRMLWLSFCLHLNLYANQRIFDKEF